MHVRLQTCSYHKILKVLSPIDEFGLEMPHRKHIAEFSEVKEMLQLLSAKAIMTRRQKFCSICPKLDVSTAETILKNGRFSAAPIEDDQIHRYLRLRTLIENRNRQIQCGEIAEEILPRDQISENLTIEELINRFALKDDDAPLFVFRGKSAVGLITAADLDKVPVKIYFFALISVLESLLISLIGMDYRNYKALLARPNAVSARCKKCESELVGLDEYNYLMTPEIFEIVSKSKIKSIMGITEAEIEELKKFRNRVAHGNYIIVSVDDVKKLKTRQEKITSYIVSLQKEMV